MMYSASAQARGEIVIFGNILKKEGQPDPLEPQTPLELFIMRVGLIFAVLAIIAVWIINLDGPETFWACVRYSIFWGGGIFAVAYAFVFLVAPFTRR